MTDQPLGGGHELPALLSSSSAVVRPRSRKARRVVWGILAVVLVAGSLAAVHGLARVQYDNALVAFEDAVTTVENRQNDLAAEAVELTEAVGIAAQIDAADTGTLMPEHERTELDAAITAAGPIVSEADDTATSAVPDAGAEPGWTWEVFATSARLSDETARLHDRVDELEERSGDVTGAASVLDDSALTAVQAAAAAASGLEAEHVNARNPELVALRAAAADAGAATVLDADAATRYVEMEAAAAAALASEQAELAEKAGPLRDRRVEIEAFARSLAPGVLLDFDWSPTVPGYGGPSYGGWTTWWYGTPGYATIALSDYIAEEWPSEWTRALIAHEVGHAISVKCESLYDASDQDTIEEWATAWAFSMGFTDRSNGTDVYGAPSQAMIDAAAACR